MKQIITLLLVFSGSLNMKAQTPPPLDKQQTLDYLNEVGKEATDMCGEFSLNGKMLLQVLPANRTKKYDLTTMNVKLDDSEFSLGSSEAFYHIVDENTHSTIIHYIEIKTDAERLIRALKHLQELIKAEKSTDPFGK